MRVFALESIQSYKLVSVRNWSECSVSCGGGGARVRGRECTAPRPAGGGADCRGEAEQREECGTEECPGIIPDNCGVTEVRPQTFRLVQTYLASLSLCSLQVTSRRIVNGRPALPNAWPWLAALGYR